METMIIVLVNISNYVLLGVMEGIFVSMHVIVSIVPHIYLIKFRYNIL